MLRLLNSRMFFYITIVLVALTEFTYIQIYYSAYVHIALVVLGIVIGFKTFGKTEKLLGIGILTCIYFVLLSIVKQYDKTMEYVGFFLHYICWPFFLAQFIERFDKKDIKHFLVFVLVICTIGDILTITQLSINPEISRLLAGTHLQEQKSIYYRMGVGGYGYVYAMCFLTYGVVRWLRSTQSSKERIVLLLFLVINSYFLLKASYTTAIIMTIVFICLALLGKTSQQNRVLIMGAVAIFVVIFGKPILEFSSGVAESMNLEWIAKRFDQLLYARENDDVTSLRRVVLYQKSINSFLSAPLFGAGEIGGHSQILDMFAQYGVFAIPFIAFLLRCFRTCKNLVGDKGLVGFYFGFLVFVFIDTCAVMQIPTVVFFVVPLMICYARSLRT